MRNISLFFKPRQCRFAASVAGERGIDALCSLATFQ